MPDLAEQLRAVVEASAEPLRPSDVMVRRPPPPRWHQAYVVVAIAAAVAVLGAVAGELVARAHPRHATKVVTGADNSPGWHSLSPGPLAPRQAALMAWTGSRLLVWGGDNPAADGALYDPTTDTWERMAPSPLTGTAHVGVWDGKELLAWDQDFSRSGGGAGAGYSPITNTWRRLAPSPLPAAIEQPVVVWDGHEVLVWAAFRPDGSGSPVRTVMWAFDPSADGWRSVPSGPVDVNDAVGIWTGSQLVVVGWLYNDPNGVFPAGGAHPAAAYDPATGDWQTIAAPPWDPGERASALAIAWTGRLIVAYTYSLHAATYDPAVGSWSSLPDLPLQAAECPPAAASAGGTVLATYCGQAALLYPALRTWVATDVPSATGPDGRGDLPSAQAVATTGRYVLWAPTGPILGVWKTAVAWAYVAPGAPPEPVPVAHLTLPRAMVTTPGGDVLIADDGTNQVLRLQPDGTLSVLAGTGTDGYGGDGGPAQQADLSQPGGLAAAPDGTVYVADTGNNRVRAIAPDGTIATVAGNGAPGTGSGRAVAVPVGQPLAVAFHGATLYIVDDAGLQVTSDGRLTTLVAAGPGRSLVDGNRSALFPSAIAVDRAGKVFVGEFSTKYLIEFSPSGQPLGTWPIYVSGAGLATAPDGGIIVADYGNWAVDRISNGVRTTVAQFTPGAVPGLAGGFRPSGVAVGIDGAIYADDDGAASGAPQPTLVKIVGGQVVSLVPAVPTVTVSPARGLHEGQAVTVQLHGFAPEDKAYLSECASPSAANPLGCGQQAAAQPFIITDDHGDGSASFAVHTTGYEKPYDLSAAVACREQCVLVATNNTRAHPFAVTALSFG